MALKESDIFNMSRFLLSCIGLDPLHYGIIFRINGPLMCGAVLTLSFLVIQTFIYAESGVQFLAISLNSFTVYYQVSITFQQSQFKISFLAGFKTVPALLLQKRNCKYN